MAKFLKLLNGILTEETPISVSTGAPDAGKILQTDGSGKIDPSFMPVGIGADTQSITASENLAAGDFVNLWSDLGVLKVRKADASAIGTRAHGFVLDAVTSGQPALVYFEGRNTSVTGLTIATTYFLSSTTPGGISTTPATGAGKISQSIGNSTNATAISTEIQEPVVLA